MTETATKVQIPSEVIARVQRSFGRAVTKADLVGRFYQIFLTSHVKVRAMFFKTDMHKQKELLRHGLNLMIMYANGSTMGKAGMERIANSHNRDGLAVDPKLYDLWEDSLLKALAETDQEFSDRLMEDWKMVIKVGLDFIKSRF